MGKDFVTMDFNKEISKEVLLDIEKKANKVVSKNLGIVVDVVTPREAEKIDYRSKKDIEGDIRLVNIPGVDICACCGVHVERTGEIGLIKILYGEKYKSGTRVYMICSRKALKEFNKEYDILEKLSVSLSTPFEEIFERVEDIKHEMEYLQIENRHLKTKLFEVEIASLDNKDVNIVIKEDLKPRDLKDMIEILDKKEARQSIILSKDTNTDDLIRYIIKSKTESARDISLDLNEKFSGKGGGNLKLTQGTIKCTDVNFVAEFLRENIDEEI